MIGSANDLAFSLPGYLWMGTNCFTSAGYILYMRQCVKRVGFADFDSVYFNNTLSIPILILLSLILDDWKRFLFD